MRVRNEDGHVGIREVKTTNTLIFTCRDDIKRPNVIVDTIAKFAAKPERPEFYYLVSGNGTHAAEICVATTRHLWTPDDTVTDDLSGNLQPCWRVPVSAIHIFKIRRE